MTEENISQEAETETVKKRYSKKDKITMTILSAIILAVIAYFIFI
jgi:hypothetical protein